MTKCLACVGEWLQEQKESNGGSVAKLPDTVEDAITWAPSWVSQMMGGQVIVAAVPAPTCLRHMQVNPTAPEQRALNSRLIIGGGSA